MSKKLDNIVIPLSLSAILFFIWISFIISNSSNRPIMDDYDAILKFLIQFKMNNLAQKILIIFEPHNEHPLLFLKLITLAFYFFFNKINFVYLIIFANLLTLGTVFLFNQEILKKKKKFFVISSLLFFNLSLGTILIWPMAILQHASSVFLALLTIKIFCGNNKKNSLWYFRYLILFISSLSGGGNVLLLPVIFMYLLLFKKINREFLFFFLNTILISSIVIFFKLRNPTPHSTLEIYEAIRFIILFLGNPMGPKLVNCAFLLGALIIFTYIWSFKKNYHKKFPVLFWNLTFIILVAIAAAYSRSFNGHKYALEEKYTIYALSGLTSSLLIYINAYLDKIKNQKIYRTNILLIYTLCIFIFVNFWHLKIGAIINLSKVNWIIYPLSEHSHAVQILKESENYKIYNSTLYMRNIKK